MSRVSGERKLSWVQLAPLAVGLVLGCGRTTLDTSAKPAGSENAGAENPETTRPSDAGGDSDQGFVPPEIQKLRFSRYFAVDDLLSGPQMVVFEDPEAPHVISLTHRDGSYRAGVTAWSASGTRFAYQLLPNPTGFSPSLLMLADAADDFAPHLIQHPALEEQAFVLSWIGDRALLVKTGSFLDVPDARGWNGRYLWIDAETEKVTDLGGLAPLSPVDPTSFARDPAAASSWASSFAVVFVDQSCDLVYVETPGVEQRLLSDCGARAEWSGDGSYLMVATETERYLYERHDNGGLRLSEGLSPALQGTAQARFEWAPHAPRFALYEGGGLDQHLQSLSIGDARAGWHVRLAELPPANHATFLTDDLVVARNWTGESYGADVSPDPELVPLGLAEDPGGELVPSIDSAHLYYARNPFLELQLGAEEVRRSVVFTESRLVEGVMFRLLSEATGLLTTIEPQRRPPGGGEATAFAPTHQYLLKLGPERAVIPLGSFDDALGTHALGIRAFQSAPRFGGIFFLGEDARGLYVDWLGFDHISRKVRVHEFVSNVAGLDLPGFATAIIE